MASPFGTQTGFQTPQQPAFGGFGTQAASPFGVAKPAFGASSPAPAFGAAPAFGGASTPAFGTTAAPAFGAPTTTSPFGTNTTPAATPAFGGFGGTTTQAAAPSPFGAAPSPFGANASPGTSAPSLFGTQTAPATASTSLFGATGASLFGQQTAPSLLSQPAPTGGIFGTAPATTSTSPFGFNLGGGAATTTTSVFGNALAPVQPQQQSLFAPQQVGQVGQDAALKEITEIRMAYTPASPSYKFAHLFLNVVENPAQRVKPPNVDEMRWRQALAQAGGPNNPDKLWPVLATGFKDLLARSAAQQAAIDENKLRLQQLQDLAHRLSRKHATEFKQRSANVQRRHVELSHRLLHVSRCVDALESRLATSVGYRADLARQKEQELSRELASVEADAAQSSASSLQRRLETVSAAARLRAGGLPAGASAPGQARIDSRSEQQLFEVLREAAKGIKHLQSLLKRDQLDVEIMQLHLSDGSGDVRLGGS